MIKPKIALLYGGYSKEEEISQRSADCIALSLDKSKYDTYRILITENEWLFMDGDHKTPVDKNDFSFVTKQKEKITPDIAYIMIHGTPGEDGLLQGYFDMLKIPYTTCNAFVSALTFNKAATKHYIEKHGYITAPARLFRKNEICNPDELVNKLGLPMFIKPNNGGSSFGVTKVKTKEDIIPAIEKAFMEDHEVIAESFINGMELTCGVLQAFGKKIVFSATEIVPKKESQKEFFDYEAKYKGLADEITPARISDELMAEVQETSSKIYDLLGCSGVVRVDYLHSQGRLYFMEINTIPGMSQASIIPQQAQYYGMTVSELNDLLIQDKLKS